jgi:hypothetical protein
MKGAATTGLKSRSSSSSPVVSGGNTRCKYACTANGYYRLSTRKASIATSVTRGTGTSSSFTSVIGSSCVFGVSGGYGLVSSWAAGGLMGGTMVLLVLVMGRGGRGASSSDFF